MTLQGMFYPPLDLIKVYDLIKKCVIRKLNPILTLSDPFQNKINKYPPHTLGAMVHSTSISACGVWGVRIGVQVSRRKLYTHIHLN